MINAIIVFAVMWVIRNTNAVKPGFMMAIALRIIIRKMISGDVLGVVYLSLM
tara:strand:+ start:37130 stop:37285 length:156 start_codon:yes stop_codon:yes gene_type:complete